VIHFPKVKTSLVFKNPSVAVEAHWPVRWREATGKISDFVRSGRSA